jgi:hypothetical protein
MAGWKGLLPVGKACTSLAGRQPFQPVRMCLAGYLEGGYLRIPASGCGCRFPWKKQPDIRVLRGHLYIAHSWLQKWHLDEEIRKEDKPLPPFGDSSNNEEEGLD